MPLAILMVPILAILVWLSFYVSPLDIVFANEHVIATIETSSGDVVELTQFWNRHDFYTTTIKRHDTQGRTHEIVVDGDDDKIWRGMIEIDLDTNQLIIKTNGNPVYEIDCGTWHIRRYKSKVSWGRLLADRDLPP